MNRTWRIDTTGDPTTTKIYDENGEQVRGVQAFSLHMRIGQPTKLIVERVVPTELHAELQVVEVTCKSHRIK